MNWLPSVLNYSKRRRRAFPGSRSCGIPITPIMSREKQIRTIFKEAFASVGLPYFNPHSFRKTLALLGGQMCKSPEEYKAWSQNLGHENVLTTLSSYGTRRLEVRPRRIE
jgi:integrase